MDTSTLEGNSKVTTPTKENESADAEPILSKDSSDHAEQLPTPTKCPKIYTRAQILALYKSPLVTLPDGMPELKDWFGSENEQNLNRKESEPSTPNSGRERRFRRDPEDGDLPARPSFRSAASQPSQMGNFKHQSLRSSDREIDRDGERLRNLSDKFDRDRLSISGLRNKDRDRDVAPHFTPGSSRGTAQAGTIAARRAETRDGAKKKVGESSEDWRRGGDVRRSDRNVNARDERDSRARDSSRSRRDSSPLRREERNDSRRDRDRDRDDYRRERDELRRERDRDNDGEQEESKRWREDGKRDERMTPRRDRPRDKPPHENSWENGDRRWASTSEDKDRGKKGAARDRKNPALEDSGKDREERRLEREKEKEPAWMDTYIPPSSGGGILGGKGVDGELDGIQAWKKNMKEKEQKAQKVSKPASTQEPVQPPSQPERQEEPMDEIQRFKQLMEAAQKQKSPQADHAPSHSSASPTSLATETKASDNRKPQETAKDASQPTDPAHSLLSLLTSSNTSLHAASSQPPTSSDPAAKSPLKSTDPSIVALERPSSNPSSSTTLPMNAPQGSRLLALGNKSPINSQTTAPNGSALPSNPQTVHKSALAGSQAESAQTLPNAPSRSSNAFSPFEERDQAEALRRASAERNALSTDPGWSDAPGVDHPSSGQSLGRGSRFAKFFDAKGKEAPPHMPVQKAASPVGGLSSSPIPVQRPDVGFNGASAPNGEHRTVEDLFAKLNMSSQLQPQRSNPPQPSHTPGNIAFGQQVHNNLQQQLQHHHLSQQQQQILQSHLHNNSRIESFAESRNFTPDGLVPGLRSAPPPRSRENVGIYQDPLDEALLLNAQQRLSVQQQQQQRSLDQLYPGSVPAGFGQQGNRNVGLTLQQQQFRGGPSPTLQSQHTPIQQQRLPPGLANLGGRPPHDPTQQLLGLQGALGSQLHSGLHMNPQQQHGFNNFHPQNSNVGFGGPQPQLRGPPPGNALNLPAHHQLGGLGAPGGLDLRNANHQQAQLLAMGGLGGGGLRGVSNNGYNPASSAQLQAPLLTQLRQQQQPPQLPPHMIPHMMPPHLQQQQGPMSSSQSAQDLMALLMGGGHRE